MTTHESEYRSADQDGEDDPPSRLAIFLPEGPRQWAAMVAALMFLAGAVGYFIGTREAVPGPESVDVGFLQDMISHHEQALQMSNIEIANGTEPAIQVFAREILLFQSYEIGLMERQLADWGYSRSERPDVAMAWMGMPNPVEEMPGMASRAEMALLAQLDGRSVDALFISLMQDHHRGGVHMASYAADNASNRFVRGLAERMARNQRVEIAELAAARARANMEGDPDGYVPAEIPADHGEHD